ncbi:SSU ribosomal protein S6p [hydrothermal vent metagenome]|uniref:SSU ribosomal protein S6p n=1 Tax=hydrothermal vent metagenome TaxID=652676 RepID=A0A3B1DT17_9ZZZZ
MARIKHYETMFIVKTTLTEEEIKAQIKLVQETIEKNGGEVAGTNDMGSRKLAYEIKKNKRGYYTIYYFTAPTEAILEIERNYRINENILRFIFIKSETKKDIEHWTKQVESLQKNKKTAE